MSGIFDCYPRRIAVGDSFAFVGPVFVFAVLRLDSAACDAVAAWVDAQDGAELFLHTPLPDGREAVLLRRLYTKQSFRDALAEQETFARGFATRAQKI